MIISLARSKKNTVSHACLKLRQVLRDAWHAPLPRFEPVSVCMQDAKGDETQHNNGETVHENYGESLNR